MNVNVNDLVQGQLRDDSGAVLVTALRVDQINRKVPSL